MVGRLEKRVLGFDGLCRIIGVRRNLLMWFVRCIIAFVDACLIGIWVLVGNEEILGL